MKSALDKVRELYRERDHSLFPNTPDHVRTYPAWIKQTTSTNGLTKAIICYIQCLGWQAERISSSGRWVKGIGYIRPTTTKGTADISATIQGKSIKIEVKNKKTKDKASSDQIKYGKTVDLTGGEYIIAKDLAQVIAILEQYPKNPNREKVWKLK